ncbi:MAG: cysteine hydrolase, partial [Gammaproteobacteria bacterium]|nr:cysteine hydrolase [Gammaproteobacteria bacterium]
MGPTLKYVHKENFLVIFVKIGFSDSYVELAQHSPLFKHNKPNNWLKLSEQSTEFDPRLDYHQGDIVVVKHRVNAFYSTSLEAILNANDIKHLILCGVSTNMAV